MNAVPSMLPSVILVGLAGQIIADVVGTLRGADARPAAGWARGALGLLVSILLVLRAAGGEEPTWARRDSLALFGAAILVVLAVIQIRHRAHERSVGTTCGTIQPVLFIGTMVAATMIAVASSPLVPEAAGPMLPALRSAWLPVHVGLAFLGEAFLTVGFAGSIIWLWRARGRASTATPDLVPLDRLAYRSVLIGYALFTAGAIVFGAIWANQAWGRYWGWDPKESWSLVTWIAYSTYLHVRLRGPRRARIAHWISITGYLMALFTLFGVNLLYRSLHAY